MKFPALLFKRMAVFSLFVLCAYNSSLASVVHQKSNDIVAYTVMPLVFSPEATRTKIDAMTQYVASQTGVKNQVFIEKNDLGLQRRCRQYPISLIMWPQSFARALPCPGFEKVASATNPVFLYQRRDFNGKITKVGIIANTRAANVAQKELGAAYQFKWFGDYFKASKALLAGDISAIAAPRTLLVSVSHLERQSLVTSQRFEGQSIISLYVADYLLRNEQYRKQFLQVLIAPNDVMLYGYEKLFGMGRLKPTGRSCQWLDCEKIGY